MATPSVTVGDEREEVVIRRLKDDKVLLVVDGQFMKDVSIGLLRSIHQAAGAYLALVK